MQVNVSGYKSIASGSQHQFIVGMFPSMPVGYGFSFPVNCNNFVFRRNSYIQLVKFAVPEFQKPFPGQVRSEEHTSELQSLMRNSYAVFCLKKKNIIRHTTDGADHSN